MADRHAASPLHAGQRRSVITRGACERRRSLDATEFRLSFCEGRIGDAEVFLAQPREFDVGTHIPLSAILKREPRL